MFISVRPQGRSSGVRESIYRVQLSRQTQSAKPQQVEDRKELLRSV